MTGTSFLLAGFGVGAVVAVPIMISLARLTMTRTHHTAPPIIWAEVKTSMPQYSNVEAATDSIGVLQVGH